jgi:hypothetical protein
MKGFKNIYSLANIAACLKDTKVYATPLQTTTNYMRCYATIDQAKNEWAYLLGYNSYDEAVTIGNETATPKELQVIMSRVSDRF